MDEFSQFRSSNPKPWLPWSIAGGLGLVMLAILVFGLMPAQSRTKEMQKQIGILNKELQTQLSASREAREQSLKLQQDVGKLNQQNAETQDELNAAIKEKEAAMAEVREAQRDLSTTLDKQITAGDVLIQEKHGQLVVDVSDQLLFEKGQAEVSEAGQQLLTDVAKSIKRLPPKLRFQVGGHTDSQRVVSPELVERYPTNWELSTARATNVVRFLQEKGKVPGRQLIAAGFAQYRPASSNNTEKGRQKNRRIEVVILVPNE